MLSDYLKLDNLKAIWSGIEDKFLKYWFVISSVALAVLYLLYQRRGYQLQKALYDAQEALLTQKLAQLSEVAKESQEGYDKSKSEYEALKRRHADVFERLRIGS